MDFGPDDNGPVLSLPADHHTNMESNSGSGANVVVGDAGIGGSYPASLKQEHEQQQQRRQAGNVDNPFQPPGSTPGVATALAATPGTIGANSRLLEGGAASIGLSIMNPSPGSVGAGLHNMDMDSMGGRGTRGGGSGGGGGSADAAGEMGATAVGGDGGHGGMMLKRDFSLSELSALDFERS
jgi:hypothetical protein